MAGFIHEQQPCVHGEMGAIQHHHATSSSVFNGETANRKLLRVMKLGTGAPKKRKRGWEQEQLVSEIKL